VEISDKVEEVFVAGVDVRFGAHTGHPVKVMDVDVDEDAVQSRQDLLARRVEVARERGSNLCRKHSFIVYDLFDPFH